MNNNLFKNGDKVVVAPNREDLFRQEFQGTIFDILGANIIVKDGDGELWMVYPEQVKHYEDSSNSKAH